MVENQCFKKKDCKLRYYAEQTIPFINRILGEEGEEIEREEKKIKIARVLRGCGESPGFIKDWTFNCAIRRNKITKLINLIVDRDEIDLDFFCNYCQLYRGPERGQKQD